MALGASQFGDLAGIGTVRETYENYFSFGRKENAVIIPALISSAALDSGATPNTTLRGGLVLGQITSSSKFTNYAATATDGSQVGAAVLLAPLRLVDIFSGSTQDRYYGVLVAGPVLNNRLFGLDAKARADMSNRFIFDDDFPGNKRYPVLQEVAKTANYTVLASDRGTLFTNTGASGAVTFTLPAVAPGLVYEFLVTADQNVLITAPAAIVFSANNSASTTLAFQTSSERIGGHLLYYTNAAGTKWYVQNLSPSLTGGHSAMTITVT